ncbi:MULTISPECIES: diaminopimelate decarboxylase [unclassified Shinella]|uniref:diaminopimelate decarboxylase n=1 Tax=unclassified Shinella TaxID=2643062 RepID=UPI00234F4320|nr:MULTISPECIES: diaminopimelate decarboxylase [unclassified Shinella]MCO5153954.1 diaminopimelate decarboxylase [Shinella sp.]MDC7262823.1 diaminopimelate decarboxylase [Shinella sp. HY16]MDC7269718.1 diaminopimelate decarboxylase [Shinella sp. YZ44]
MPLSNETLIALAGEHGTPLWIYDAAAIRRRIEQLSAFDVVRYAQKACSNIHILGEMRKAGVRVDAVSLGEVERAKRAGYVAGNASGAADVVFTADLFDRPTLERVVSDGIEVNAGSIDMLRQLGERSPGHRVWLRLNPGFGHGHSNKTNTGGENSKHGIWFEQLQDAMALVRQYSLTLVGLHMHIGSGVDYGHLERVCGAMVALCRNLGADLEAISAGGGLSVPYREGEEEIEPAHYFSLWDAARREIEAHVGHAVRLEIEPGRYLAADSGVLVSEVRAVKTMGRNRFVLVDAGFSELARPAMYGSYHHITAIPERTMTRPTIVAGPLCESGDVFTQTETGTVLPRDLPDVAVGEHLVFHGAGAYGATMSSNYNSRLYVPEVLVDETGARLIRRRQTLDELLALETI